MAEPLALAALVLDALIGWPDRLYARIGHPVGIFARVIGWCERSGNRPEWAPMVRRMLGLATMTALIASAALAGLALEALARATVGAWWWLAAALFAWPGLAQRSLYDHVARVAEALEGRDLPAARQAVGQIVGRDVAGLDEAGIARGAIESLSESFCDGVVAPLFWLVLLGLPGLWAYKAINTADSLIGHREERWRAFGWAAARIDDVANLVPARIAGILLCLAGRGEWRVMWRDARLHASPNAGWPEAAMAGAMRIRLGGPLAYDGVTSDKPWIGLGGRDALAGDVRGALRIYVIACALLWAIVGGLAWAL